MRDIFDKLTNNKKEENTADSTMKSSSIPLEDANADEYVFYDNPDEEAVEDTEMASGKSFASSSDDEIKEGAEVAQSRESSIEETIIGQAPATMIASHEPETRLQTTPILAVGQCCHIGKVRGRNEDSIFVLNSFSGGEEPYGPFGLYVVADGMGGHHAGHEASKTASTIMARDVTERILLPLIKNETGGGASPQQPIGEVMLGAIQTANKQIHNPDPDKEGGTTVTAALILGHRLFITHVGDSRGYLYIDNQLKQVTTDHSYVRRLMDAGQITEEEAALHPQRNMLYRAVGAGGDLEVETFTQTLPEHGKIILCSDGLWGLVPDPLIEEELKSSSSLQGSAESLVEYALSMGGHDNISIIIVDFTF